MKMSRREFIGLGVASAAVFALAREPFALFAASRKKNWVMPDEGRLSFVLGQVFVNERQADVGDVVGTGDVVSTGSDSEADIEIRDYSIFHLRENSAVRVGDMLSNPTVEVRRGWFLIIVRKGTPLEIRTPAVLAGVRGTVVFFNVLNDEHAYLCNCNGTVELANPSTGAIIQTVTSSYHTAFTVSRAREAVEFSKAGLLYHTDGDILRMSERFPRETRVFNIRRESGASTSY